MINAEDHAALCWKAREIIIYLVLTVNVAYSFVTVELESLLRIKKSARTLVALCRWVETTV